MKRLFNHPLAVLFLTLIAVIFMLSLAKTRQRNQQVSQTAQIVESQVEALERKVTQVQAQLNPDVNQFDLKQERVIRDELLMQKEGEVVIQLPAVTPASPPASQSAAASGQPPPWQEWRRLLFN